MGIPAVHSTPGLWGLLTFMGNPEGLRVQEGWGVPCWSAESPRNVGTFRGQGTHTSSSMSTTTPSASPSPSDTVEWGAVVPGGWSSTARNRAWSPFSASTLPPDTGERRAPRVRGHWLPGTPTWGSLLHPMCPITRRGAGQQQGNLPHSASPPRTRLSWHPTHTPMHHPTPWSPGSGVPLRCSLPPGHRILGALLR